MIKILENAGSDFCNTGNDNRYLKQNSYGNQN